MHLKRFAYDGTKIHCRVDIEEHLDLCKQHFVLSSVVLHQGTETIGHYYTMFRERDNQWVQLDDQNSTRGLSTKVAKDRLQRHAYLCLYKAVQKDQKENSKGQSAKKSDPEPAVNGKQNGAKVANGK